MIAAHERAIDRGYERGTHMAIGDRLKGAAQELGGKVKEATGVFTENPRQESEGRADQVEGELRQDFSKGSEQVKGAGEGLKGRIERVGGAITGDTGTEVKGKIDELKGDLRRKINK